MNPLDFAYLCITIVVALYLWRRVGLRVGCAMLVLTVLLLIYGPAHLIFQYERELNQDLHSTITVALMLMWTCLLAGLELPRWLFPRESAAARRASASWNGAALRPGFAPGSLFKPVAIVVLLLLAIDLVAEGQLGKVATYYGTGGLLEDQAQVRQDEGGSRFYLINILVLTIAPFLSMVLLCEAARLKTWRARAVFTAAFVVVLFAKLSTLQKSPAAIYLLQMCLAYWLIGSNRPKLGTLLGAATVFLLAMIPLSLAAFPGIEFADLLGYFYRRIIEAPQETLEDYFAIYPGQVDFLYGLGFRWLHALIGTGQYVGSSLVVATLHESEGASFNAVFIADSWADFGFAGIAVASLGLGIVARLVDLYAYGLGKTSASVAILASMLFAAIYVASASFAAALLTAGLALVPIVAWLLRHRVWPRVDATSRILSGSR
ncbi:MAG: hypothetical protein ABI326_13510 [Caldimonas sp.]